MLEQTTIDIGRYARVPYHVATAKISSRARDVWILLAMNCSPENPEVWVRQATLANQLDCSTDTTSRATQELVKIKLLLPTQKWHQGRHKIYRLVWGETCCKNTAPPTAESQDDLPQKCVASQLTYRTNAIPPAADLRVDVPQKCGPLNRILINQEQNIFLKKTREDFSDPESEKQNLLSDWGETWKKRFTCLDGLSGRPSIENCVEQALNHNAREKAKDLRIYVEMWLQRAAKDWFVTFNREQNAPATDPSLDKEAIARRCKADNARSKEYYNQPGPLPVFQHEPFPAKLQAEMDEIFARREPGFSEKLLQLMKKHNSNEQEAQSISPGSCQLSA